MICDAWVQNSESDSGASLDDAAAELDAADVVLEAESSSEPPPQAVASSSAAVVHTPRTIRLERMSERLSATGSPRADG